MESTFFCQQKMAMTARQYGTPLYLYHLETIGDRYHTLITHLPENVRVHYALKANSNLTICHYLAQQQQAAEVSSLGELMTALKSGFSPTSIVFTGPGKTDAELAIALEKGIQLIVVESPNEACRLNHLAAQHGITQDILLRINPQYRTFSSCDVQACNRNDADLLKPIAMNGQGASKFGVDEADAEAAIAVIQSCDRLNLRGIHVFTESNVLDYQHLLEAWRNTIHIANRLRQAGHPIAIIDFGGGIGVPYNTIDRPFDMERFGSELAELFASNPYTYDCIVEIGRYLVCEAGYYITDVVDVKRSQGQRFVILNGGIHHLYRTPAMQNASKYLQVLDKENSPYSSATLAGQLPTPIDVLVRDLLLPDDIQVGDIVVIRNCGAYGFNHSLTNFALHPHPAEVASVGDRLELIRSRGTVEDFFTNQHLLTETQHQLQQV
ncbi:hypothetical protein HC928_23545 [bacterium]|nr:hypothetical protein [bacterium]